jgi:catechol 1,2-dioxygenase
VTTHIFLAGDPYLASDAVFGVKASLVEEIERRDDPADAAEMRVPTPFWILERDFRLAKETR